MAERRPPDLIVLQAGLGPYVVAAYKRVQFEDGPVVTVRLDGRGRMLGEAMHRCQRLVLQFLSDPEKWL